MPNRPFIDIVTQGLASGLIHPGDDTHKPFPLPLPTFRPIQGPPEMAEHFAKEAGLPSPDIARLTAEALDELLEASGKSVVDTAEITRLRKLEVDTEPRRKRPVRMKCNCGGLLFGGVVDGLDTDTLVVHGHKVITEIQKLTADCLVKHQPSGSAIVDLTPEEWEQWKAQQEPLEVRIEGGLPALRHLLQAAGVRHIITTRNPQGWGE